jgi:hypothetical protein
LDTDPDWNNLRFPAWLFIRQEKKVILRIFELLATGICD